MTNVIEITGAKEHNLKNISLTIPKNKFVIVTGLSGSGKSSLAFDTLYAEGHRRYVDSLSSYARHFLHAHNKPNVESIQGLSPAIAIDQKGGSKTPRSTVGTITEIYDYLRLLYARIGIPHSPVTGQPIISQTASQIVSQVQALPNGMKIDILAPIVKGEKGVHTKELLQLRKQGFQKFKVDDAVYNFSELPVLDKNKKHSIDIVVASLTIGKEPDDKIAEWVQVGLKYGNGIIKIDTEEESTKDVKKATLMFSEKFACHISGFQLDEIEPRTFSFNSPFGACSSCDGLGVEEYFDHNLVVPNPKLSINDGALAPWRSFQSRLRLDTLQALSQHYKFNLDWPFEKLAQDIKQILLYGSGNEEIEMVIREGLYTRTTIIQFDGVIPDLKKQAASVLTDGRILDLMKKFQSLRPCQTCEGHRLRKEALCVKIDKKHIGEVCHLTIKDTLDWIQNLPSKLNATHNDIASKILKEMQDRLKFLLDVGLDYLTLSRNTSTLSGGEHQRIRLASQIGSGLSGVLYVLDEPSIGLHQCDNEKLIKSLLNLVKIGNTVIVVEHDEETMLAADHIIDIGPGAGIHGGYLVAEGSQKQIMEAENSITGQYLSGKKYIPVPKNFRKGHPNKSLKLRGAQLNNLRNLDIDIPLGTFTCVTGVSGSGKSSLIIDTLYKAVAHKLNQSSETPGKHESLLGVEYLDKIIEIDQSPIGKTPRSNPATYTGAFNPIRDWFTNLPESRARNYKPGRFSFNVKGGRCEVCQGDGLIKIEMHFLPDVYVTCEECQGKRYNKETVEMKYNSHSIADVLNMTVEAAQQLFATVPAIKEKLDALYAVGLGYIKIGQSATTLSGGEAQRIKLAKELSKHSTGKTLYILDEPTTGLHVDDISKLLKVLQQLVELGNTVVVIEHNMEVIKTADYIIDIGPGGGNKGGSVVASGTPYEVAKNKDSMTGQYLKHYLFKVVKEPV